MNGDLEWCVVIDSDILTCQDIKNEFITGPDTAAHYFYEFF